MEVIIDTNFVISCIKKKIDFIEQLQEIGFRIALPREVLQELKDLKTRKETSRSDRDAIELAFKIFENQKLNKIRLGEGKVDDGLIKKGKEGAYIATLDNGIKRQIPNKVVILDSKNRVEIERS